MAWLWPLTLLAVPLAVLAIRHAWEIFVDLWDSAILGLDSLDRHICGECGQEYEGMRCPRCGPFR